MPKAHFNLTSSFGHTDCLYIVLLVSPQKEPRCHPRHEFQLHACRHQLLPSPFAKRTSVRSAQLVCPRHMARHYSVNLPRLCLHRCHPVSMTVGGSRVSHALLRKYTPPHSSTLLGYAYPDHCAWFHHLEIPKQVGYSKCESSCPD